MDYETLSNAELNQILTGIIFKLEQWELTESGRYFFMEDAKEEQHVQSVVSYCTDWNATMPLAMENKISLIPSINEDYYRAIPVAGEAVHSKNHFAPL